MTQATRAQFLSRGTKGGIALVAGSSLLAVTSGDAFAAMGAATDDVAIAKLAATAELLAMDFYTRALKSKQITKSDELGYMSSALANEKAHYAALKGVLKGATPAGVKFKYPAGAFASRKSIGQLGMALETAFVGAYMGAVTALKSTVAATTAAFDQMSKATKQVVSFADASVRAATANAASAAKTTKGRKAA